MGPKFGRPLSPVITDKQHAATAKAIPVPLQVAYTLAPAATILLKTAQMAAATILPKSATTLLMPTVPPANALMYRSTTAETAIPTFAIIVAMDSSAMLKNVTPMAMITVVSAPHAATI